MSKLVTRISYASIGMHSTIMSELWSGSVKVATEHHGNRAHAGAWCKGAKAAMVDPNASNPYAGLLSKHPGAVGRRAFRNAWRDGFNAARALLTPSTAKDGGA